MLRATLTLAMLSLPIWGSHAQGQAIILVRHGERNTDGTLSPAGNLRAWQLATLLAGSSVRKIYSTDTPRTRATAQPLAQTLSLPVTIYDEIPELAAALRQDLGAMKKDEAVLVVGHSNTVPETINRLRPGEAPLADLAETDFGNLFLLSGKSERSLVRLHY